MWERNEQSFLIKTSCWLNLNTSLPRLCMELSGPTCSKVGGMYVNCRQFAAEMCWPHAAAQALSYNGIIIELCGEREISFHSNWIRSSALLRQTCSHHSYSLCFVFFFPPLSIFVLFFFFLYCFLLSLAMPHVRKWKLSPTCLCSLSVCHSIYMGHPHYSTAIFVVLALHSSTLNLKGKYEQWVYRNLNFSFRAQKSKRRV